MGTDPGAKAPMSGEGSEWSAFIFWGCNKICQKGSSFNLIKPTRGSMLGAHKEELKISSKF